MGVKFPVSENELPTAEQPTSPGARFICVQPTPPPASAIAFDVLVVVSFGEASDAPSVGGAAAFSLGEKFSKQILTSGICNLPSN